jgi:quinol monooxygenase YgiN
VRIVAQARRAVGCLDVAICANLVDHGRVNIFECWESQTALETFRSSGPDTEQRLAMRTVSVQEYDSADVRPVFGKEAA